MKITGETELYAVLGRPVRHSLSPVIYNALFAEHGVDAVYVALDVAPGAAIGPALVALGLAGANLTVPHKAAVLPDLDEVDPSVDAAGAANVVRVRQGALQGYNTDSEGFCRAFEERFGDLPRRRAVLLGAGGAARAIAAGLAGRGVPEVVFLNRTPDRARAAAAHLSERFDGCRFAADELSASAFARQAGGAALVVNATSGAGVAAVRALDPGVLPADAVWCDLNYWMDDPPAVAACRARGLRVQGGLDMLIHQAALAFEVFTGRPVAPVLIRRTLG